MQSFAFRKIFVQPIVSVQPASHCLVIDSSRTGLMLGRGVNKQTVEIALPRVWSAFHHPPLNPLRLFAAPPPLVASKDLSGALNEDM
jgi:hypothetical protein